MELVWLPTGFLLSVGSAAVFANLLASHALAVSLAFAGANLPLSLAMPPLVQYRESMHRFGSLAPHTLPILLAS